MNNLKICFVILHYMNIDETQKCVTSIISSQGNSKIHIVIVDNGSTNGSGKTLLNNYKDNEKVTVIQSTENLGFARGNNIGYHFALSLKPEYVAVINSDTEILQKDFVNCVDNIYSRTHFDVLGPDIINLQGKHQNPMRLEPLTDDQLLDIEKNRESVLKHINRFCVQNNLKEKLRNIALLRRIKNIVKPYRDINAIDYRKEYINPVLHGSCYIFSKKYMTFREEAFNPKTFLFFEEDILYDECLEKGLKLVYSPLIRIKHHEDGSTDYIYKKNKEKIKFIYTNQLASIKVLKEIRANEELYANKNKT